MWGSIIGAGLGLLAGDRASDAANAQANAQAAAAREAAEAARFRPVGVTTRFGSSQFQFDNKGNITGAGYGLAPDMRYIQDRFMGSILGGGYPSGGFVPQSGGMMGGYPTSGTGMTQTTQNVSQPVSSNDRFETYLKLQNLRNEMNTNMPDDETGASQAIFSARTNRKIRDLERQLASTTPQVTGYTSSGGGFASPLSGAVQPGMFGGGQAGGAPMAGGTQPAGGGFLGQALGGMEATAPMATAGQGLMGLGLGYLGTSPQEQAAKYMQEQQALLAPTRAAQLSTLQNKQFQQGRTGLAVGGEGGMMATNPEMAAYYNALNQQDRELAAAATQGGMDYARFGAGLVGTGGGLLGSMYDLQSQAFQPYRTAMGEVQGIEGLGQQAMDLGMNIGAKGQANASSQQLLQQGLTQAAATRANAPDPWSGLLSGARDFTRPYIQNMGTNLGGYFGTSPNSGVSSQVSGLGSSTWNPWSDYNTGSGGWGNYGE